MAYYAADFKYEKFEKKEKTKEVSPTHNILNVYPLDTMFDNVDKETLKNELLNGDISVINALKYRKLIDISHSSRYSSDYPHEIHNKYKVVLNFMYQIMKMEYINMLLSKYDIRISTPSLIGDIILIYMLKDGIVTTTDNDLYDELVVYKTMFLSGELLERMINDGVFIKL